MRDDRPDRDVVLGVVSDLQRAAAEKSAAARALVERGALQAAVYYQRLSRLHYERARAVMGLVTTADDYTEFCDLAEAADGVVVLVLEGDTVHCVVPPDYLTGNVLEELGFFFDRGVRL